MSADKGVYCFCVKCDNYLCFAINSWTYTRILPGQIHLLAHERILRQKLWPACAPGMVQGDVRPSSAVLELGDLQAVLCKICNTPMGEICVGGGSVAAPYVLISCKISVNLTVHFPWDRSYLLIIIETRTRVIGVTSH
jgi:hypothetical protein